LVGWCLGIIRHSSTNSKLTDLPSVRNWAHFFLLNLNYFIEKNLYDRYRIFLRCFLTELYNFWCSTPLLFPFCPNQTWNSDWWFKLFDIIKTTSLITR
jgi:hypothetical protein